MYEFTKDCLVGVEQIDEEHRNFFTMINEAQKRLTTPGIDVRITARVIIKELRDYASTHFAHEEAYMKKIKDPELSSQKLEHADFTARMNEISIEGLDDETIRKNMCELLQYLSRWLFRHIIGSDTLIGKFESPFAFTSKYHTGIELVDQEHQRLFEIIADANKVIHAELLHDKYDEIVRILSGLKDYTEEHFRDEEACMEEMGYPELDKQRQAHEAFIEKLAEIDLDSMDDNQQEYLEELIDFLLNWLSVHILQMDKKIGEYANLKKM
ncbi:MAG: bacteriohemerythrin [Lachnospiraceae bacterium]|nr:bacteriohemerythrin [Lachnospiraceae bacterium]MBQ5851413.1 bacteriohemerythrin [Lachnospiraceae bacterium]MEE1255663.1 bacteriohemerythrin [Lachnospiraceae bacterium]